MTKNGRRVNCYCLTYRCHGKNVDWRTRDKHAAKDADNRPLYPVGAEELPHEEHGSQEPEELVPPPTPPLPYGEVPYDEIVSHVETLPSCNDPVFETVPTASPNIIHIQRVIYSLLL
jgi:hypothetical protein